MIVYLSWVINILGYVINDYNKFVFFKIEVKLCNYYYVSSYSFVLCVLVCDLVFLGFVILE